MFSVLLCILTSRFVAHKYGIAGNNVMNKDLGRLTTVHHSYYVSVISINYESFCETPSQQPQHPPQALGLSFLQQQQATTMATMIRTRAMPTPMRIHMTVGVSQLPEP